MDEIDIDMIQYAIAYWADDGRVDSILCGLPVGDVSQYIHRLPPAMCRDIAELDLVRNPPKTIDDFLVVRSSNYRVNPLESLTEEQVLERIRNEDKEFKQRDFLRYWALHDYFYGECPRLNPAESCQDDRPLSA